MFSSTRFMIFKVLAMWHHRNKNTAQTYIITAVLAVSGFVKWADNYHSTSTKSP